MALRVPRFRTLLIGALAAILLAMVLVVVLVETTRLPGDRPVAAGMVRDSAFYLTTRDGTRIAIDRWLPEGLESGEVIPTLVRSTRYWRAGEVGPLNRLLIRLGMTDENSTVDTEVDHFNREGFAVLLVDARGTGASFGARRVEWGEDELRDLGEVADWIVAQPWSNGRVGSWGVSYEGNTAAMLAATGHPAVRAVAPQFVDYDAWRDLVWPGGVFDAGMIGEWGEMVGHLDRNDICSLAQVSGMECMFVQAAVPGVKPVNGRDGRKLLEEAVASHATPDIAAVARAAEFADDPFGMASVTFEDVSIRGRRPRMEEGGAAVFLWSGWMDAGTQAGALRMAAEWAGHGPLELVLGPWSHGGGHDTDPFRDPDARPVPTTGEQLRMLTDFFEGELKEAMAEADAPPGRVRIRYRPLGMPPEEEGWWETPIWPPTGTGSLVLFGGSGGLVVSDTGEEAVLDYRVDFTHSAGPTNRWQTQLGGSDVRYPDRASADALLLTFDGDPLEEELVLTGAPILRFPLSLDQEDGAVHAYLELVGPDGEVRYLTEGMLRLIHRGDGSGPTFLRSDARAVVPGERMEVRVEFFPTAAILPAGHRLRLALGGADAGMFARYPAEGEVNWRIGVGGEDGLRLELPVSPRPR